MQVYNGVFYDSPKLQRLCGERNPGVLESYGNTMRVVFKTDGYKNPTYLALFFKSIV
jgi:hypothetical protein